jgi:hypothetical protein
MNQIKQELLIEENLVEIYANLEHFSQSYLRYCEQVTRAQSLRFKVCSVSEMKQQWKNVDILQRCNECERNKGTISGICCDVNGLCL